jgi:hypothetical protein
MTSPLDAGTGVSTADAQGSADLSLGIENPMPCSGGPSGSAVVSTFDGGGIIAPSSGMPGASAAGASALATPGASGNCSAQASTSASGITSASNPTSSSSSSSSSLSSAPSGSASATDSGTNSAAGVATGATSSLGTAGLGAMALGATALGAVSKGSGNGLEQTASLPALVNTNGSTCAPASGATSLSTLSAKSLSGTVPDPAQGLGSTNFNPAQTLAGAASVPEVDDAPCPETATGSMP